MRSPLDWPAETGIGRELAAEIRAEVDRRRRRRIIVASCAVLAMAAGAVWWSSGRMPAEPLAPLAEAQIAAPERRTLEDGSVMELRAGAIANVSFSDAVRRVELTRGEVHFTVAKNPARPFVVAVDGVEVRAVGTAFAVARTGHDVDVLVTEGRVALARTEPISREGSPAGNPVALSTHAAMEAPVFLGLGDRTTVQLDANAESVPAVVATSPAEMAQRLAWRVPRFEFSGASLSRVVQMFNERGFVRLAIEDRSLESVRISGVLRADNVDALLQLLAADHGIETTRDGATVRLRRR